VGGSAGSFTNDANGNLINDGVRTYEWDAEDRLVAAVQGVRRSEFAYDGAGRRVRIVEKDGATVLSDRRYLWCGLTICEERDAAGTTVTRRFFPQGMQEGTDAYFYTRDHLGSIRELTDSTGVVRARYEYDPYGRQTKVSGDKDSPFGFTGHFVHSPSGLLLAPYRPYSPSLGRWLTEDPIGLAGGGNLYAYVSNGPTNAIDPTGEIAIAIVGLFVAGIVLTAIVTAQMIRNPPQLPPLPPSTPTTTPPRTPPSGPGGGTGGSGGGGGAGTGTGGSGGATTSPMSPPTTGVPPFPIPPNTPCDINNVNCKGLLQSCLSGFMTGPCWSCAQICEATKSWPYKICHGPGKKKKPPKPKVPPKGKPKWDPTQDWEDPWD
jgi:RHS repeat-associated protein